MDAFEEVPTYLSDEDDLELQPTPKRRRGKGRIWKKMDSFSCKEEAENYVKGLKWWSFHYNNESQSGRKAFYRCNRVKKTSEQCPSSLHLHFHSDSDMVTLYKTEDEHRHEVESTRGISEQVRDVIRGLYNDGITKPNQILRTIEERNLPVPPKAQLRNFLQNYRKEKFGLATISLDELDTWCKERAVVPEESQPDAPFVVNWVTNGEADYPEEYFFRIFISTRRLLSIALLSNIVHADATYKLIWQGFPVLMIGTTDKDRCFNPFGLGICRSETAEDFKFLFNSLKDGVMRVFQHEFRPTVLVADASTAITNGFTAVFGTDFTRVMCWAHVIRAIDKKLDKVKDRENRLKLREDILFLQQSHNAPMFRSAAELFIEMWSAFNNPDISNFIEYFKNQWLVDTNIGWFEGMAPGVPSTNNALESTNNVIKKEQTFRERWPLSRFLAAVEQKIILSWSMCRDPTAVNTKQFISETTISLKHWTEAYQWAISPIEIKSQHNNHVRKLYITPTNGEPVNTASIKQYQQQLESCTWSSFEDYKKFLFTMWVVELDQNDWKSAICTCRKF